VRRSGLISGMTPHPNSFRRALHACFHVCFSTPGRNWTRRLTADREHAPFVNSPSDTRLDSR
jgi:hypothetical protein